MRFKALFPPKHDSCRSVHSTDEVDELFHILNVTVRGIFRVQLGAIQNNNLDTICSQRFKCTRQASCFARRFTAISKAPLLVKNLCYDIFFLSPIVLHLL